MIALGCDHGGYDLMQEVITFLEEKKIPFKNFGTDSKASCDYPVFGKRLLWQLQIKNVSLVF